MTFKISILSFLVLYFIFYILAPSFVLAQTLTNPLGSETQTITDLLKKIVTWLVDIGGPIAVGVIIYGAIQMVISVGDPAKFKEGKQTILYAVIGYAIILVGWGIVSIITNLLKTGA